MGVARRILMVDDEPNVRLVFRTALESAGHELAAAEDGQEALDILQATRFDLVLLDLRMPRIGGMELLGRLRAANNDVPVIIITAHGSIPDAVAAMKLGAIDFLSKPLTPDALRRAVAEVLDRQAARPAPSALPALDASYAALLREAKQAINRRKFDEAEATLGRAVGLNPASAEAYNLMGVLQEGRGDHDASYAAYKAALKADRGYGPAKHNMKRYYDRFTFGRTEAPVDTGEH